ncbi:hypothetical protein LOAG_16116 [Loa loa]|uniref:Uncharacterized protein n=1 Tax=Loa loa TaxID=7209 RepID=A0A1S0TEW7_LOALO|nr:hypothetical protein LOAG_16116 [Loa loa]EFO12417.1 hypothetical protein LOAG_16116 [Loa loa]
MNGCFSDVTDDNLKMIASAHALFSMLANVTKHRQLSNITQKLSTKHTVTIIDQTKKIIDDTMNMINNTTDINTLTIRLITSTVATIITTTSTSTFIPDTTTTTTTTISTTTITTNTTTTSIAETMKSKPANTIGEYDENPSTTISSHLISSTKSGI